ncbi:MAG: rhomboid family intramembrane serine protease [Anaerolineae bacterium]|jgi:membrane associated rhomboid family serine protease|nr:rhomboid family intramembrane serine protease [Anaerolineae bacterium]
MLPLRDDIPSQRFPVVNTALIALNVLVFLAEVALGEEGLYQFILSCGLTPAQFWQGGWLTRWWTPLTSMFIHAGWLHLISNMLSLYIFGDNVEDRIGHFRYLLFYLGSGLASSFAHLIAYAGSPIPTVGASGAIAGVLGAYLVLFPRARVVTLVPIFYFIRLVQIPAVIYLGFWFVSQLFNGFLGLAAAGGSFQGGGVAWWAHIGGFAFGFAILGIVRLFTQRRPPPPPPPPYYYVDSRRDW